MSPRAGGAVKPADLHQRKNLSSLADEIDRSLPKRRDMSCHDYLIALLHLGSSLEHALMVQYLSLIHISMRVTASRSGCPRNLTNLSTACE